jgi:hypothetical protein
LKRINHYEANFEFRSLYSDFEDAAIELQYFLTDIHKYITNKQARLSNGEIYSKEFEELFCLGLTIEYSRIPSLSRFAQLANYT